LRHPNNTKYFKSSKLFIPQPTIPRPENRIYTPLQSIPLQQRIIEIPDVTIVGHPGINKVYNDKYEEIYQYADIRSLDSEILWSSSSLENAVRRLISHYRRNICKHMK